MSAAKARVPTDEEFRRITTRGVAEIIPQEEFTKALRSGRPLRLKMGFDPTKPVITLGWAVGLRKLRQLQDLGHTVVVIIGDWTARIGDPSGQSRTRKMLPTRLVRENANKILEGFFKVLDRDSTEVKWQREWFDKKFPLTKLAKLASHVTVSQMLERDDFAKRYASGKPIRLQELLYPLLQAYDSVEVEADVEFGGSDQRFNILLGRDLQPKYGQGPQSVFLVPLLVGLDGTNKMSQSLGNYIAIDDPPQEMYGKLMSIPDALIMDYFELLTDVPDEELAVIRQAVDGGGAPARDAKMRLAREIVAQFHITGTAAATLPSLSASATGEVVAQGAEAERTAQDLPSLAISAMGEDPAQEAEAERKAQKAEAERKAQKAEDRFVRTYREREVPEEGVTEIALERKIYSLPHIIQQSGLASSRSAARRLVNDGAVRVNGNQVTVHAWELGPGDVILVGKLRVPLRIVDADKQ